MKYITTIIVGVFLLMGVSCAPITATNQTPHPSQYRNHTKAKVTYYFKKEDKYGSKIATGGRAKEGVTVAVRRKLMQLGQFCHIPQFIHLFGHSDMRVEDRGRNVERLKASHGKTEVVDTYLECNNRREFNRRVAWCQNQIGDYVDIYY
jgi:hypothetical protein